MALDPGDPSLYLPTPANYATPAQLQQARSFAQRLQQQSQDPGLIRSPTQGVAKIVQAMISGLEERDADQQEMLGRADAAGLLAKMFSGQATQPVSTAGQSAATLLPGTESGGAVGDLSHGAGPVPIEAAKYAIAGNESDNRPGMGYGTIGPQVLHGEYAGDRAYGRYQVMGKDLPDRLAAAGLPNMSPQQFLQSPQAQELEFEHEFGDLMQKYGSFNDAASMWFSGHPMRANDTSNDGYMSTPAYIAKANASLARYLGQQRQPQLPPTPAPVPGPTASDATVGMMRPGAQLAMNTPPPAPPAVQQRPAMPPAPPVVPPAQRPAVSPVAPNQQVAQTFGALPPGASRTAVPGNVVQTPGTPPIQVTPGARTAPTPGPAPVPYVGATTPAQLPPGTARTPTGQAVPPPQFSQARPPIPADQLYPPVSQQQLYEILRNPWIDQVDPTFKRDLMARMQPQVIEGDNGDMWRYVPGQQPVLIKHGLGKEGTFEPGAGVKIPQFYRTTPTGDIYAVTPQGLGGAGGIQSALDFANRQGEAAARAKTMGEEGAKAQMQPIGEAMKEAKTASNALNDLNIIEDTVRNYGKGIVTGPLAEHWLALRQAVRGTTGIDIGDPTGLQASEVIKKMNAQLASAELPAFTARGTQFDLKTFMQNNPGLTNSPEGTLFLTNILKQYHRQSLGLAELAADQANWPNWAQVQKNYLERNPLINPLTGHVLGVYKDTAQQGQPTLSAPSINTEVGPKSFYYDARGNRIQ
jgi:hypothetical protein